jgi:hypothetical protein
VGADTIKAPHGLCFLSRRHGSTLRLSWVGCRGFCAVFVTVLFIANNGSDKKWHKKGGVYDLRKLLSNFIFVVFG